MMVEWFKDLCLSVVICLLQKKNAINTKTSVRIVLKSCITIIMNMGQLAQKEQDKHTLFVANNFHQKMSVMPTKLNAVFVEI